MPHEEANCYHKFTRIQTRLRMRSFSVELETARRLGNLCTEAVGEAVQLVPYFMHLSHNA